MAEELVLFAYRAQDEHGRRHEGVHWAAAPGAVQAWLGEQGLLPVVIREAGGMQRAAARLRAGANRLARVRHEDLIVFTRQLATLVGAGIPLLSNLKTLAAESGSRPLGDALADIAGHIERGGHLSDAFARHPAIFSTLYVNMLKVGEVSGKLDVILERLADLLEYDRETGEQIKAATRYPKIAGFAVVLAMAILMTFVVPRFITLFDRNNLALPLPTRMLIGLNTLFQDYWLLLAAAAAGAWLFYRRLYREPRWRLRIDRLKLRVPVFGRLFLKLNFGRFARMFSLLLASGVPLLTIFDIVGGVVENAVIAGELVRVRNMVERGKDLAGPMRAGGFFPPLMIQMVAAGEQSGSLDVMLSKVADYFEQESRYLIKNLTTLIEPLLILVLGGFVLFIALAIFLPWWNMMQAFR
ncbi:MAG: type II secretion system F family protein [Deltaproteobacteria bacterium]|nr:type II secretion system F family protein [Candidatus Anaeroferrophillacea bacterium]